jgi:hypothetical protein
MVPDHIFTLCQLKPEQSCTASPLCECMVIPGGTHPTMTVAVAGHAGNMLYVVIVNTRKLHRGGRDKTVQVGIQHFLPSLSRF